MRSMGGETYYRQYLCAFEKTQIGDLKSARIIKDHLPSVNVNRFRIAELQITIDMHSFAPRRFQIRNPSGSTILVT